MLFCSVKLPEINDVCVTVTRGYRKYSGELSSRELCLGRGYNLSYIAGLVLIVWVVFWPRVIDKEMINAWINFIYLDVGMR